ncbi:hypothetical protein BJ508DRAFT_309251 [Ascobolus immersus RN42]|uniref:Uncharacterized protein n=1 Tax=Ascobolus immersus RN42 TaxID=1160509 RepID=A0A3N4HX81_ASCIM|nr:hypothetical protein BJ508DRAFT_309251 [Ascobolus immersus RN42]
MSEPEVSSPQSLLSIFKGFQDECEALFQELFQFMSTRTVTDEDTSVLLKYITDIQKEAHSARDEIVRRAISKQSVTRLGSPAARVKKRTYQVERETLRRSLKTIDGIALNVVKEHGTVDEFFADLDAFRGKIDIDSDAESEAENDTPGVA